MVDALVEQGGVDLRRRQVGEARLAQQIEHGLRSSARQRAGRAGRGAGSTGGRGQTGAPAIDAGARQAQGGAGGGRDAGRRRQGKRRRPSGSAVAVARIERSPQQGATFFWISMIASARSRRCRSRAFSCRALASSAASGLRRPPSGRAGPGSAPEGAGIALAAPIGQGRRIEPFAAQNGADVTGPGGAIGFLQDAQLLPRRERPALGPVRQFGIGRRWRRHNRRPPAFLCAGASGGLASATLLGMTTGQFSYALKSKLPGGLCLIIIGTEGSGCGQREHLQRAVLPS